MHLYIDKLTHAYVCIAVNLIVNHSTSFMFSSNAQGHFGEHSEHHCRLFGSAFQKLFEHAKSVWVRSPNKSQNLRNHAMENHSNAPALLGTGIVPKSKEIDGFAYCSGCLAKLSNVHIPSSPQVPPPCWIQKSAPSQKKSMLSPAGLAV